MTPSSRRKFIIQGAALLPAVSLLSSCGDTSKQKSSLAPVVISTWDSLDSVNKEAWGILKNKGKAIDAVGKTLGFFIGGALEARRQGIENEEMDKYNKLQEYTSRNTQTAQQTV